MVWPLVLCSVAAAAIVIERLAFFWKLRQDNRQFTAALFEHIKHNRIKEALALSDHASHPMAAVLKAGILKFDRPRQQIREAMEDAALYELPVLEKNLFLLSTISLVAPLIGFLGTAAGMLRYFHWLSVQIDAHQAVLFLPAAAGVWEAMVVTAFGLLLSVCAFTAHAFLSHRSRMGVLEIEKAATEMVSFLTD